MKQNKIMILVHSEEISLYGLIDGYTPEEVKARMDELMNMHIKYIREGCELRFDFNVIYDEPSLTLNIQRKETDEEYAKRLIANGVAKEKAKASRLKEYLKLKAEFEGENNGA
jgi:hypothetical protein